jgi:hypothetical protein
MNSFQPASAIGQGYQNFNGVLCKFDSTSGQFIVIAKTQKDATGWENLDMA